MIQQILASKVKGVLDYFSMHIGHENRGFGGRKTVYVVFLRIGK